MAVHFQWPVPHQRDPQLAFGVSIEPNLLALAVQNQQAFNEILAHKHWTLLEQNLSSPANMLWLFCDLRLWSAMQNWLIDDFFWQHRSILLNHSIFVGYLSLAARARLCCKLIGTNRIMVFFTRNSGGRLGTPNFSPCQMFPSGRITWEPTRWNGS